MQTNPFDDNLEEDDVIYGPNGNNRGFKMTEVELHREVTAARNIDIEVRGSDEGVPSVDELLKKFTKPKGQDSVIQPVIIGSEEKEQPLQTIEDALEGG